MGRLRVADCVEGRVGASAAISPPQAERRPSGRDENFDFFTNLEKIINLPPLPSDVALAAYCICLQPGTVLLYFSFTEHRTDYNLRIGGTMPRSKISSAVERPARRNAGYGSRV